jgi:hypothetical protein
MTLLEIMDPVSRRAHMSIEDDGSDYYADVLAAVRLAVRYLQGVNDWSCHKAMWSLTASTTPALTAGTYEYAMRTLNSDFRKIQADAIHWGNNGTPLFFYDEIEEFGRRIGPEWKRSATANGSPELATMMGQSLVIGPKPSQAWITINGEIHGYYYRAESLTTVGATLLMYEDFFEALVEVALIYLLNQEDDSDFRALLQHWEQSRLQELRGYEPSPQSTEQVSTTAWAGAFNNGRSF